MKHIDLMKKEEFFQIKEITKKILNMNHKIANN